MAMPDLTIGVLARRTGVGIETIRYYERRQLLPAPPRTAGGHRLYRGEHVKRLIFIRRSRALGFSLDEIRTLLRLVDGGAPCGEVRAVAQDHLERIRAKLAELERMARALADTAARCEGGSAPRCPIVEDLLNAA
jgi:MerR family transcriptional regulator, mercuric resistance operon regulatory protein